MMRIFRENRSTILDNYSREFEKCFMDLVRRRWRTKRVFANKVYNEYISDRNHIHMNATIWESLTSFVKYLGRTKQCDVDETDKGWYIKYIDRDPDVLAQQEAIKKKEKMDMDDDMRNRERIQKMIAALQENATLSDNDEDLSSEEELENSKKESISISEGEKVQFKLTTNLPTPILTTSVSVPSLPKKISFLDEPAQTTPTTEQKPEEPPIESNDKKRRFSETTDSTQNNNSSKKIRKTEKTNQLTALEQLTSDLKKKQSIREKIEERKKIEKLQKEKEREKVQVQSINQTPPEITDNWLIPGLVVKVMNKSLGEGSYYGKKGKIVGVADVYVGIIQMVDTNHKLKIDQLELETVIPAIGSDIAIVNGEHRGKVGILEEVNVDTYKAIVRVDDDIVQKDYEDVCKISDTDK